MLVYRNRPYTVTSANSLSAFRQQLKHTLFQLSFPDIITLFNCNTNSGPIGPMLMYVPVGRQHSINHQSISRFLEWPKYRCINI